MLENEKQSSGTVTPDEKKPEVWIVKVYNTFSGRVEPVEVSKAVYDEYRRGEWRTEKRDGKEEFRVCPKFCVNSKSQCKIEQKLLFWGVSPLSTL